MLWRYLFLGLCSIFCIAYPIAVIGVAFDVNPPFSLAWAASALLFLEGGLLLFTVLFLYGWVRALLVALLILALSYFVETVGVTTGFPFGAYRYTDVLFPRLPGGVPLAVLFAWIMIVLGVYGILRVHKPQPTLADLVLGAVLATLLDFAIEPVASQLEHYWLWLAPGPHNYYGVPLVNFAAWLLVAFVLLVLINLVLSPSVSFQKVRPYAAVLVLRFMFAASVFMFALTDLTHGYYWAALLGPVIGMILYARTIYYRYRVR